MSNRISEETKRKQGRCTGHGKDYIPGIFCRELMGIGVTSCFPDWQHGRMIQCLSQGELWWYLKLRWNDDVLDIREQFLLDPSRIESIATSMGTRPAQNGKVLMSTDFLVDTTKGLIAINVKTDRKVIEKASDRKLLLLEIERRYWDSLGIPWKLVFKEDLNRIEVANIKDVVRFYDRKNVFDDYSLAKHLIATKRIIVNMKEEIDYLKLISELKKESIWEEYTKE